MFDFHMHSRVSYDSPTDPAEMVQAAVRANLKEICFTDHLDRMDWLEHQEMVFEPETYREAYRGQSAPGLKIRHGCEIGLQPDNRDSVLRDLAMLPFDFVIGSVHLLHRQDLYGPGFWDGKRPEEVYLDHMEETLHCVQAHDSFDVLGHLTYAAKADGNPTHSPMYYRDYRELADEIMKELVRKGKGMEINTSGIDRCGVFLPDAEYLRRFRELGGEIVTMGSDAHTPDRVGKYTAEAAALLKEIFGYVCTFEARKPIFHKL